MRPKTCALLSAKINQLLVNFETSNFTVSLTGFLYVVNQTREVCWKWNFYLKLNKYSNVGISVLDRYVGLKGFKFGLID